MVVQRMRMSWQDVAGGPRARGTVQMEALHIGRLDLIGLGIQLRTGKNMSNQNKHTIESQSQMRASTARARRHVS